MHSIKIDKTAKAYEIIGCDEVNVNSRHVRYSLSQGKTKVVAVSPDGIDEIIEDETKAFYIGVQFHPESLYQKDKYMNNIFVNFLNICSKQKSKK